MAQGDIILPTERLHELPAVRTITLVDLRDALAKGVDDFWAMPTHVIFLSLIYPIVGIALGSATFGYDVVPLLFPLAAGFALIGPFAAIGLYELSRRREQGLDTSWRHAFDIVHSPSIWSYKDCECRLACRGERHLRGKFRRRCPNNTRHLRAQRPDHTARTQARHSRQCRGLSLRACGFRAERGVLPPVARSPRRCGRRHHHLDQSGPCQSSGDGLMGAVRSRSAGHRLPAVPDRSCPGDACARPFDLALVPQGRRARPEPQA